MDELRYVSLTAKELSDYSRSFNKKAKKTKIAYTLCVLGGFMGLHRFYTGNYGTAIGLIAVTIATGGIGAIAGYYDAINIERLIYEANKDLKLQLIKDVKRK